MTDEAQEKKMGEFTKRVRNGDIAGPLRRAFTTDSWTHAFNNLPTPDAIDYNTHAAGLAIHKKLHAIRSTLKLSSSNEISATTKLRAFVAISNHDFFVMRDKTKLAIEKFQTNREKDSGDIYALEEMAGVKISLHGGFDWSPNEIVEGLVDGIELPIRVVLQAKPSLAGNPRMNQVQWREVSYELNLGILYRFTEDIWDDCLWNSYRMVEKEQGKMFLPQDIDAHRAYHIGLARRTSLSTAFALMASQYQREALSKGAQLRIREVCGIERRGKHQVIKISRLGTSTEIIEEIFILRGYATEPYYGELLKERQESLQGLTLSTLIDAWTVLSRTAQLLVQSLNEKHPLNIGKDKAHTWLPEYAPTLQIGALVEAMTVAIGIKEHEGRRIVDFFTFRGEPGQEIWAQPLVPVGTDTVTPVFSAIVHPNLRRLVDVWMRQAGVDLSKRGAAFERHIRELVTETIEKSKLLSPVAKCIQADYTFRPPNSRDEQIDLTFSIGNTVFIAEAKCILEPSDAKGISMHRKTVIGAAKQILRKTKAIEDNRLAFITEMRNLDIELTENFKIVPLIVVSTGTHVGIPALGVPVVDEYILGRFLEGELEDIAYQTNDPSSSKRSKTIFYSNALQAEDRASAYFASPPQMKRFLDGVRGRVVPIYPADKGDWSGHMATMSCVAGGVPLSLQDQTEATINAPTARNTEAISTVVKQSIDTTTQQARSEIINDKDVTQPPYKDEASI
ncbi:hypothetical protein FE772_09505 [Lysobacter enzymogenes]|nr:hypothetical protein [Lysobacter enzymogenes]QCW25862.1 hypothetical protein FE772_09505 [Lysobacter enzymogenes]